MKYIWYCFENLYSKSECQELKKLMLDYPQIDIIDVPAGSSVKKIEMKFAWYHKDIKRHMEKMIESVSYANSMFFGFNLTPLTSYDIVHLNMYKDSMLGEYSWHTDGVLDEPYDYKITAILNLTDEDIQGGDFQINPSAPETIEKFKTQGSLLVIPSFIQHRVTPVTKGTRITLSTWIKGPGWQ